MELQACIEGRRSVRKYKPDAVSREAVKEMIQAAIYAPSWKNSQTSRYYVLERDKKDMLFEYLPDFNQRASQNAPILIVSTVVTKRSGFTRDGEYQTHLKEGFQYYDHGMQAMNLCLKAHELGLSTLIMGIYDEPQIRTLLNIGSDQEIVCVIAVGYADGKAEMPKRKTVEDITVFK